MSKGPKIRYHQSSTKEAEIETRQRDLKVRLLKKDLIYEVETLGEPRYLIPQPNPSRSHVGVIVEGGEILLRVP